MILKQCVEEIIDKNFSSGDFFDSHTVISLIVQDPKYHLAYLQGFHEKYFNCNVAQYHGHIAKELIGGLTNKVKAAPDPVVTLNIYGGKPTKNELWQKI